MAKREVRERIGYGLLDMLRPDHFASFVWVDATGRFGECVSITFAAPATCPKAATARRESA